MNPKIFLIAKSQPNWGVISRWLEETRGFDFKPSTTHSTEAIVEYAGRVCYDSFRKPRPGGTPAYIRHLIESGHGSVLEHISYTFAISGISRACSHELVRHRAGFAYSQRSQRYCDEGGAEFVFPDVDLPDDIQKLLNDHWEASKEAYGLILAYLQEKSWERKKAHSIARYVLPQAIGTEIIVTANARAWRHFVETRGSRHADREIRLLANKVLAELQRDSPDIFGDYVTEPLGDGTCEVTTEYRKV